MELFKANNQGGRKDSSGAVGVSPKQEQRRAQMNPNPNKVLWEKGDFTKIAQSMRESGDELVESLGIRPGLEVLDLGCGDGTTAVPEA